MKLLFPTDFSDHARMALDYAIQLSTQLDAELHLIHVYQDVKSTRRLSSIGNILEEDAERNMKVLLKSMPSTLVNGKPIKTMVNEGDIVNTINAYAKKFGINMIIMGTQGTKNLKAVLFGSVTAKLISHSAHPVLAIPLNANKAIDDGRILLAVDNKTVNETTGIQLIKNLSNAISKKIDLLHIQNPDTQLTDQQNLDIKILLDNDLGQMIVIDGNDVSLEIRNYVENHDVTLLIMIKRKHSLYEKIFYKSHISAELAHENTPILVISE